MSSEAATRDALLRAAVDIVERDGGGAIGLREATRMAGLTHGAPYRHFRGREELIGAVAEEGFRELMGACLAAQSRAGGDPLLAFRALGVAYVTFALEHPGWFRVMFGAEAAGHPPVRAAEGAVFALCVSAIASAQRKGLVVEGDTQELAMFAWSSAHGIAVLVLDGLAGWVGLDTDDPGRLARRITRRVFEGLAAPGQSARRTRERESI